MTEIDERQQSFFVPPESPRVKIPNNGVLEKACNRLLLMVERDKTLLDGMTMADINRRLYAEICWEDFAQHIVPPDKKQEFINGIIKTPDSEVYSRGTRFLLSEDLIRVSSSAIRSAEKYRARISGSMR